MFIDCVFCASKYNVWMLGVLWWFLLIQGIYTVHPCIYNYDGDVEAGIWMPLIDLAIDNWLSTVIIYLNCDNISLRCNGLEFCSRRISCFHAFWCFPRSILAIFHIANVFLSGFPFFFSTEVLCDEIQKWNVKSSIEVQDEKTCRTGYLLLLLLLCWTIEFVSQYYFSSTIVYSTACYCITIDLPAQCLLQEQEAYAYIISIDLASIHKCSL